MDLKPTQLVLRCYAEMVEGQWQAFCLDLTLAAQAESFAEVKGKLEQMIVEYVADATTGQDKEHAGELLLRRAPFRYWLKWYRYSGLAKIGALKGEFRRLFTEALPLTPELPLHHV